MTFGVTHYFEGGTQEQYERSLAAVHPDGGKRLPAGQVFHAAGPTDGGWYVIALWDSEESWVKFRDETLMPGLASLGDALPGPPVETTFRVHNSLQG